MPSTACLWLLLLLFQMPFNLQGGCNSAFSSQILLSLGSCHPDQGDLLLFAIPTTPLVLSQSTSSICYSSTWKALCPLSAFKETLLSITVVENRGLHGLNLHLSANSSLVISLLIFLFLKWVLCRWRFEWPEQVSVGDFSMSCMNLLFQPCTYLPHRMIIYKIACSFQSGTPTYRQEVL